MAISPLYVPLFTIEEVILDKDSGLPLSGGVVSFYRDLQRQTPKEVYQITGNPPDYTFASVGSVLTLGIAGDFVDNNGNPFVPYAYPYDDDGNVDLYYVTVESAGSVDQFTREAVPYLGNGNIPPSELSNTENELSNPQFVEVLFSTPNSVTINVTGSNTVTPIAPDWDIISSGTGTITLQRLEPTSADIDTNPPYAVSIAGSSGLGASITLRQRLSNSPSISRGQYVSGTILAAVLSGGSSALTMTFAPSTGTSTPIISAENIPTDGAYHLLTGNNAIPEQSNDPASTGYTDILITIPTSRTIAVTSIQIVTTAEAVNIPFTEQTASRQKDHLFHYYENSILHQPKESLLTGWNFGVNPWQFRTTAITNVVNNTYTADQTIIVQQAYVTNVANTNNVAVGQGVQSIDQPFQVQAVTSTNKFAMIQYISSDTMAPYWQHYLSSMVTANLNSAHNTVVNFKMRLIYRTAGDLPPTIGQNEPISSWTNVDGSDPTFASGWAAIAPLNDPVYTLSDSVQLQFSFDQFLLPAALNTGNMILGIVLYTTNNMNSASPADSMLIYRVSLVDNNFAIDCNVETFDESLRKCQYYYEQSYDVGTLAGANTLVGAQIISLPVISDGATTSCYPKSIFQKYKQTKRAAPASITFYTPAGTIDNVNGLVISSTGTTVQGNTNIPISHWSTQEISKDSIWYSVNSSNTSLYIVGASHTNYEGLIQYHYVADVRLGK